MINKGFTLSEVLITIAVIGVVAAMTLPVVINKTQERQFITAWKKSFAEISNACLMLKNEDVSFVGMGENDMLNNLAKYIKHTKICREGKLVEDGCAPEMYPIKTYSGQYLYGIKQGIDKIGGGTTCMLTNRGSIICMDTNIVHVDVNGYKLPNTIGKDIFSGTVQQDTLTFRPNIGQRSGYGPVDGVTNKTPATTGNGTCQTADYGYGCSAEKLLK